MPDYLWPYVLEQNAKVMSQKSSQYETWSDKQWIGVEWRCLRFPVGDAVGVILFPIDEKYLEVCDRALGLDE